MTLRTKVLQDAAELLEDDNLVWSSDLDHIRRDLAHWLRTESSKGVFASLFASNIAEALTKDSDA